MSEKIIGFNLGTIFHGAQRQFRMNGFLPLEAVQRLKAATPTHLHSYCRMTGTQSNEMTLSTPGYNNPKLTQQFRNQNVPQSSISYWYAFIDFYKKWGYKGAAITLNTNSTFYNRSLYPSHVEAVIEFLLQSGINIVSLELGNELYYYPDFTLIAGGSPNLIERIRWGRSLESEIEKRVRAKLDSLEFISDQLRLKYDFPLGIPVSHPVAMRERIWTKCVGERTFYDFVVPHIYTGDASDEGIEKTIIEHLSGLPALEKRVTEFNFNYQLKKEGHFRGNLSLLEAFERNFSTLGINSYFFHCLWNGLDDNGFAKGAI